MTREQIKSVLDRVLTWPQERQQDAADMLLILEAQEGEFYHPSDDEWDAIQEGMEDVGRGEVSTREEIEQVFNRRHP